MADAKHTPGPWTALNRGYKSHVTDGDMNWSAEIIGPGHAANARLIAAAPELLEAGEAALPWISGLANKNPSVAPFATALRAAIAKAKGE